MIVTADMPTYAPVEKEIISTSEYIKLHERGMPNIKSVDIIPAKLGSGSFGQFSISFKNPELRVKK